MKASENTIDLREAKSEPGYKFVREIGSGGYGIVYLFRAKQTEPKRDQYVAGKFVYRQAFGPPTELGSQAAYQRALEGLQNFRSVSSASEYLLRIFEVRRRHDRGYFCYMMELADDLDSGRVINARAYTPRTLKNELVRNKERHRLPAARCVEIAIKLARGLQILHESGFTHRDVRPANIIFVNDIPKLADIDLLAGHDHALPSYIPRSYAAPEGGHSSRADIFSFGKTLYEICTGLPVESFPSLPTDIRHWEDHPLLLKLNKIIGRATSIPLRRRYASAAQMLDELQSIQV